MVVFTKKMPEKCVQDRLNANTVTLEHVWNVLIALFFCRLFPFVIGGFTEMGKQTQLTQKACRAHACGQRHLIKYCKGNLSSRGSKPSDDAGKLLPCEAQQC